MTYGGAVVTTCEVICRCRKRLDSFTKWKRHLQARHPKLYKELRENGDLEQDRIEFGRSRNLVNS